MTDFKCVRGIIHKMSEKSLCAVVREAETNYLQGSNTIGKYVNFSMHDTIETIDAYLNSKHISGETDSLGREKPFFNIVIAACNVWYRATDLDRRNIHILPNKQSLVAEAFIATVLLQQWMDKARFGTFLNQWGRTLAKYGSAVVKFVEKDGELSASVIPWNRLIVDPVDFDALPRIEKFYKTEDQLYEMVKTNGYDKKQVESLCENLVSRKTLDGKNKDNQARFIELYEVHGVMSRAIYKQSKGEKPTEEDDDISFQQMHVVSFVSDKEGEYKDFTLYSGKEKRDPYMITHLIEEDGRTLAQGAVEYLFDAQWMQNHSIKQWKDQLDLASRLIFQTADTNFLGRNVLSAIETGDILVHADNKPLSIINNQGHDVSSIQGFSQQWRTMTQEITSTPDAIQGSTMPSGTAYRQVAILNTEAHSLFEIMTENKANHLEDMLREFVIPHLKTKMDTKDEIVAILDEQGIAQLDAMYVPRQAIRNFNSSTLEAVKKSIESIGTGGEPVAPQPFNAQAEQAKVQESLSSNGNMRSFKPDELDEKTWKEALTDLEWNLKVEITNENTDKEATLSTLSTVLQTIATNPAILQDPNAKMIFSKILTETGRVSPLEISSVSAKPVVANAGVDMGALGQLKQ